MDLGSRGWYISSKKLCKSKYPFNIKPTKTQDQCLRVWDEKILVKVYHEWKIKNVILKDSLNWGGKSVGHPIHVFGEGEKYSTNLNLKPAGRLFVNQHQVYKLFWQDYPAQYRDNIKNNAVDQKYCRTYSEETMDVRRLLLLPWMFHNIWTNQFIWATLQRYGFSGGHSNWPEFPISYSGNVF